MRKHNPLDCWGIVHIEARVMVVGEGVWHPFFGGVKREGPVDWQRFVPSAVEKGMGDKWLVATTVYESR